MIDSEHIRFAKTKLTNSAKIYWQNVLQDIIRLGEPLITQWAVMKAKLQENYIPPSYESKLFSNMINLKQMTLSVVEYFAKFEEARLRCSEFHAEDQFSVCTHFINGLRFDIQKMVKLLAPYTIEDAYKKALEVKKFSKPSSFAHTSQSMSSNGNTRPNNIKRKSLICVTLFMLLLLLSLRLVIHRLYVISVIIGVILHLVVPNVNWH